MNIQNNSKTNSVTNSIFSKLYLGLVKTIAVLVVVGMGLSCSEVGDTAPPVVDLGVDLSASSISTNELTLTFEGEHEYSHFILSQDGIVIAENIPGTKVDYKVTDLIPNKSYTFSIQVCNGETCAPETVKTTVITKPMRPEGFKPVRDENTATSLSLTWEASTPGGADHYNLYRGNEVVAEKVKGLKTSVTGLELGTTYTFDLVACNAANLCSITNTREFTTPPTSIRNLRVVQTYETEVIIQWEGGLEASFYELKNGDTKIDDAPEGNVKQFRIQNLEGNKDYTFSLQACNEAGCSDPATVTVKTKEITEAPDTPGRLAYTKVTSTTVELDWEVPNRATYYQVFYTAIDLGDPEVSSRVDTSEFATTVALTANTRYKFEVIACNVIDCSSRSDSLTLTTAPEVPADFAAGVSTTSAITLTWKASSGARHYVIHTGSTKITNTELNNNSYTVSDLESATGYTFKIQACNDYGCSDESGEVMGTTVADAPGGFTHESVTSTSVTLKWNAVTAAKSYIVYTNSATDSIAIATNGGATPATTYTVAGLTANSRHSFSVVVCVGDNSTLCSAKSDYSVTTTPNAPTAALVSSAVTATSVDLAWVDSGVTSYVIYRDGVAITTNTGTSYQVSDLDPNTEYVFKFRACGDGGCSDDSPETTVLTRHDLPRKFDIVTNENTQTSLSLIWEAPESGGVDHYMLYRGSDLLESPTETKFSVTGLDPGTVYTFDLVACNQGHLCSFTNSLTTSTLPEKPANLLASEVGSTFVKLTWVQADGTTSYVLKQDGVEITAPSAQTVEADGANEFRVEGLEEKTPYEFSLQACSIGGCSEAVTIQPTTVETKSAPGDLVGLKYTEVASTNVTLDWEGTDGATHYQVFYTNRTGGGPKVSNQVTGSEFTTPVALVANSDYLFEVRACNARGCGNTALLNFVTAPVSPAGLSAEGGKGSGRGLIYLTWTASPGATYYVADSGNTKFTNFNGSSTGFNIYPLERGTEYTFEVVACGRDGCSSASTATATTAPNTPDNLTNGVVTSTSVELSWDKAKGATSYVIYQDNNVNEAGGVEPIATNSGENTAYTVGDLEPNRDYGFAVSACVENSSVCSDIPSDRELFFIKIAPAIPEGFKVGTPTTSAITLTWTAASARIWHYVISIGSTKITNYNADSTEYTVSDLEPGTAYTFKLQACRGSACSDESTVEGTTLPNPPENFTHATVTSTTVGLTWEAVTGAKSYIVYQDGQALESIVRTDYTISSLAANRQYTFSVKACIGVASTLCSDEVDYTLTTAPLAPQGLVAGDPTSSSVNLSWSGVDGASQYVIYQGSDPVVTNATNAANAGTAYLVGGLTAQTSYTFTVVACNAFGCSEPSNQVGVNTPQLSDSPTIIYPKMASEAPGSSAPVIVSGRNCDLQALTSQGKATYSIDAKTLNLAEGRKIPTLPTIDERTGVVNNNGARDNGGASAGTYKVTVTVNENSACNIDALIYNTVIPEYGPGSEIRWGGGIEFYGNEGDYNYIDTSEETDFSWMFQSQPSFNGDISKWETSKVTSMDYMFYGATNFNGDISKWDTSQVTSMYRMFYNASDFNGDISKWDTSKVRNMAAMFQIASKFNQPIGEWKTSNVTDMSYMFNNAVEFNQPIGEWNVSKVTNMSRMFFQASKFNGDISKWETSKVTSMEYMFYIASEFNRNISGWNTSQVINISGMFSGAKKFNQPIGKWKTPNVTDMSRMFDGASAFDQPLNDWDTSKVKDMKYMFSDALVFNQPLSNWNTSQVENMVWMFGGTKAFKQNLSMWNVDNVTEYANIFEFSEMLKKLEYMPSRFRGLYQGY